MIIKKIRFKNFFSAGNSFIEIDIQKYQKSVISGSNGNGKSTIANAITFVNFGKTVKKVTKSQIVNSINGKNCLVEQEFTANNKNYLIRRGIKPNIFEIFEDGVLVDQSSVGDYQTFLEEKILKCSYRTFLQTSILSIENYQPFMGLPASARREFIEDILDIRVFSTMNQLVKSQVSKNKEELRLLDVSLKSAKDKIILQKSHIAQLEEMKQVGIDTLDAKLIEYSSEIDVVSTIFETADDITKQISDEKAKLKTLSKEKTAISSMISGIRQQITLSEKDMLFFESNDTCPTCRQPLDDHHVGSIVDSHKKTAASLRESGSELIDQLKAFKEIDDQLNDLNVRESTHNSACSVANSTVTRLNRMIGDVNREKEKIAQGDDIPAQKAAMCENAKSAMKLRERQLELTESQAYADIMLELFKDTGVKAKIVDQFVPIINTLVNQYLGKLDFFVSFTLDSNFVESIKSRHRDDFTYSSFSAGERMKIDMALMFTFRQLAKMRNSFTSNLFLCDEILDSSLDSTGIDLLMNIFNDAEFTDTNIMVISHRNKEFFEENFDGLYEIFKRDGFTCIKE